MFTKKQLDEFRFEEATNVTYDDSIEQAIKNHDGERNLTYFRRDGSYRSSVHHSILKQGADFAKMVMTYVAMKDGPYAPTTKNLFSKWAVNKTGAEGSFFYKSQLIRWYVDEHSPGQLSLYVKIDRKRSFLQRISYKFSSKKQLSIRSDWRKNFA